MNLGNKLAVGEVLDTGDVEPEIAELPETPEVRAWQRIFRSRGAEFPDSHWINAIGRGADDIPESQVQLLERLLGSPCLKGEIEAEYERLRISEIEE